jgi:hypothetical protein
MGHELGANYCIGSQQIGTQHQFLGCLHEMVHAVMDGEVEGSGTMSIHTCDEAEDFCDLPAGDMIEAHEEYRTRRGDKTCKGFLAAGAPPGAIGGWAERGLAGRTGNWIHEKGG